MSIVKYAPNRHQDRKFGAETEMFAKDKVLEIAGLFESLGSDYNVTPLVELSALAQHMGLGRFFVKDESKRGQLKAFKLLGGAYAVANCLCRRLGLSLTVENLHKLKTPGAKAKLGDIVFAAASDGNHGKSVAWAANHFGHHAVVYMPKGTARDRIEAIERWGGSVVVSNYTYDWCVREVSRLAGEKGWEVIADTASEGDTQVPAWVMQGYSVMGLEAIRQLGDTAPTHVFLQAGVGSLAAAMTAVFANFYGEDCPHIYILEPHKAACFYASGLRADGETAIVDGEMDSIMAGLSCGVPNPIAWKIIRSFADGFFSCDDVLSANGMRILGNPMDGDTRVISGESGAIGTGFLEYLAKHEPELAAQIGLDESSAAVVFSTEGDTDTENYRDVVWYGKYPFDK